VSTTDGLVSPPDVSRLARDHTRRPTRKWPSPLVTASLAFVTVACIAAVLGERLAPLDPSKQDLLNLLSGPSGSHLLGTDELGRDVFSRTVAGARTAVVGPLLICLGGALIGNVLGLAAGYLGGKVDAVIMRWVDLMYALPPLLVALVVVGVLDGGYYLAVALLIVATSPYDTRIVRAAAAEQRPLPYIEAARTLGVSRPRIMFGHILPNVLPLSLAQFFLNFAFSLVALAGLSFLGLGVGPGEADWGRMLSDSRTSLFVNVWTALGPGLALVLLAASMNLIGDWLYERFDDRGKLR
jgi:peptide/nickel transport system permease protein